jgi:hypothetical protein
MCIKSKLKNRTAKVKKGEVEKKEGGTGQVIACCYQSGWTNVSESKGDQVFLIEFLPGRWDLLFHRREACHSRTSQGASMACVIALD